MSAKLITNSYGQAVRVRTGRARLSFPKLFERDKMTGKYGATIMIPKDDEDTLNLIKEAIENAKEDGKERVWGGKIPAKLRIIVNDGDQSERDEENGYYTIAAKSNRKIDVYGKGGVLLDEDDIYPGCWVQAIIEFYPYDNQGKGISATLEGIKKVADGERFGGGGYMAGADDFDDDGDDEDDDPFA